MNIPDAAAQAQFSVEDKLIALARVVGELAYTATGKTARVKIENNAGDFIWMDLPARSANASVEWITSEAAPQRPAA